MTSIRKPAPPQDRPSENHTNTAKSTADIDKILVDGSGKSLWAALFDGDFRLAVACDICGRYLTSGKSKSAGRGPKCAAKVVAE